MTSALRRQGLVIVATLATAYVASHFFRAANVTIGLDLMRDLRIGPEALGALTGAFFFGFSAMQIPCGFFLDRFGPRRLFLLGTLGTNVLGLTFSMIHAYPWLLVNQGASGFFRSLLFAPGLVLIASWFPPNRRATARARPAPSCSNGRSCSPRQR